MSRMSEQKAEQKRLGTKIPESVQQVKKIVDSKYWALPYIKGHVLNSKLVKEQFHGHQLWFTISVYVAQKHWWRFLQTCKHYVTRKGDGCPKGNKRTILLFKARPYAIFELITKDDKIEAKRLIEEYNFYKKNLADLPSVLSQDWQSIVPCKATAKRLLNHFTLHKEEVEAEQEYKNGNVKTMMEMMRKLFYLPSSSGGGVHYK